jgi:hypothetical protein
MFSVMPFAGRFYEGHVATVGTKLLDYGSVTRVNIRIMYRVAYRILVPSLVVCLLLVGGLWLLERTGLIEIDEREIQPEVVSCQIGHNDMEVSVQGSRAAYRGEVVPRYEFWLPPFGGCAVYYWDRPNAY